MSTISTKLKDTLNLLSELNNPPVAPSALINALDSYLKVLYLAKKQYQDEERFKDFFAEVTNSSPGVARRKIDELSDADFKRFCVVNRVKIVRGKKEKRIRGKVIRKAAKAKNATRKKAAQPAVPEVREVDMIIPAQSDRQATTEYVLNEALLLKSQTIL